MAEHHARREAHEARPAIGLDGDQARDLQRRVTQQQGVAELELQRVEQRGFDPHAAGFGCARRVERGAAGFAPQLEASAQRVGVAHRLDGHQPRRAAAVVRCAAHAGKSGCGGHRQPAPGRFVQEGLRCRLVARHDGVAAHQLACVAAQAPLEAVGEEAHRSQRGHGQRHCHQQQTQFAGAEVAQHLTSGQSEGPRRAQRVVGGFVGVGLAHASAR